MLKILKDHPFINIFFAGNRKYFSVKNSADNI